jgi:hypothetical protein
VHDSGQNRHETHRKRCNKLLRIKLLLATCKRAYAQDLKQFACQDLTCHTLCGTHGRESNSHVARLRRHVDFIASITASFVVTATAQRNALLGIAQVFLVFSQAASVMDFSCYALALHAVPDSLADDVVR